MSPFKLIFEEFKDMADDFLEPILFDACIHVIDCYSLAMEVLAYLTGVI